MMQTNLPVLFLRESVLLPYGEVRVDIDNDRDKEIIKVCEVSHENFLLLVNLTDPLEEVPITTNLPDILVMGRIKSKLTLPNGNIRIVLVGHRRVKVLNYLFNDKDIMYAFVNNIDEDIINKDSNGDNDIDNNMDMDSDEKDNLFKDKEGNSDKGEETSITNGDVTAPDREKAKKGLDNHFETLKKMLFAKLEEYISNDPSTSNDILGRFFATSDIGEMIDTVTSEFPFTYDEKIKYINEYDDDKRFKMLMHDIGSRIEAQKIENEIEFNLSNKLDMEQREYVLREKIKLIKEELGEVDIREGEIKSLRSRASRLDASPLIKSRITREINGYEMLSPSSPEVGIIRSYIEWLLSLPWNTGSKDNLDTKRVEWYLNESHYGLREVKDLVLEYASLMKHNPKVNSPVICLVGPPGVGKTSIAREIAKSLNKKFVKVSVGGVNDEAMIKGHRRTYIGASPGKIIEGLRRAKVNNPVFLIDEIDKLTSDYKGDPASSLLDVLDKEQNMCFVDNYIEEEVDLSNVFFILTANDESKIPDALRDRLEIVRLSSYSLYDKMAIAKSYLIPRLLRSYNLTNIHFTDKVISDIITYYTKEAGVRELERLLAKILRKTIILGQSNIILSDAKEYLGRYVYVKEEVARDSEVGCVNALGHSPYGGSIVPVTCTSYRGCGNVIVTGMAGEVVRESVNIALSYIKSNAKRFGIDFDSMGNSDFHIHLESGTVPKEGPSAGIAIVTSLISHLTLREVSSGVGMTGEITLRGKVLAIGGLREKLIAARERGLERVFIPRGNVRDLELVDSGVRKDLDIILVSDYLDIFEFLFEETN